jgi:DtxR family Mn-dependent transcriptional regulator
LNQEKGFYTMKGYELRGEADCLSSAEEDYLEMITRLFTARPKVRIRELSEMLHVKASSASKMVQQLAQARFLEAPRYGDIILTERGVRCGTYLLYRHTVINHFLCVLNHTDDELEQVEKIEHFLDERTVRNLELLCQKLQRE